MYRFDHPDRAPRIIIRNEFCVMTLVWARGVIAIAGLSTNIVFYDEEGVEEVSFDNVSEYPTATCYKAACRNSTGEAIVFGTCDCVFVYSRNRENFQWERSSTNHVENMQTVTAIDWKQDGSMVALGTIWGITDLYDVAMRAPMKSSGYEAIYVSHSQMVVRKEDDHSHRVVLSCRLGLDIKDVLLFEGRYFIGHTDETVFIADLDRKLVSEVEWYRSENRQMMGYNFDDDSAVIIHDGSELSIVEIGSDEILGTVRTCKINTDTISLRLSPMQDGTGRTLNAPIKALNVAPADKLMAYLLDDQNICIKDLVTNSQVTLSHDYTIDWLELNPRGDLLLYRDQQQYLHIFFLNTQTRKQLLSHCNYVQWVPDADVIVAGSLNSLVVWYNVRGSEQCISLAIKGEIIDIERRDGRTEVIVDEGLSEAVYPLDESLVEFTSCVLNKEFIRAMNILEDIEMSLECEDMWRYLGKEALESNEIAISQRCAAASGDVAADAFLGGIVDLQRELRNTQPSDDCDSLDHYAIRNKLALFKKDIPTAEEELLSQSRIDECIDMYLSLQRHEDAIRVAKFNNRMNRAEEIRDQYMQSLLNSGQNMIAGVLKEEDGEFIEAIQLYLKASAPNKASRVIEEHKIRQPLELVESVASSLVRAGMHDRAGVIYERLDEFQKALDSFIRGKDFRSAVNLARKKFPARVVELQEKWGDFMASQKHIDMAINHYIEAKMVDKAIDLALNEKYYAKALQLVENTSACKEGISSQHQQYYARLGDHYSSCADKLDVASRCFIAANQPQLAVITYLKHGNYEIAEKLAKSHMNEDMYKAIYSEQAEILEKAGDFNGAESLLLRVREHMLAIDMYKRNKRFSDMLRLTAHYYPDRIKETNLFVAAYQENVGCLKDAENFYIAAAEGFKATQMYVKASQWNDALRCAKSYGDQEIVQKVVNDLFINVGVPGGVKLLEDKHASLLKSAVTCAVDEERFDIAYEIAQLKFPEMIADISLKHALHCEDRGDFKLAEEKFIEANRVSEAIDMYIHIEDWTNASRMAREYFDSRSTNVFKVMISQAKSMAKSGRTLEKAEVLFIGASEPGLAIDMYMDAGKWEDAHRVAKFYMPQRLNEIIKASTLSGVPSDEKKSSRFDEGSNKDSERRLDTLQVTNRRHNSGANVEINDNGNLNFMLESLNRHADNGEWSQFWEIAEANIDLIPTEFIGKFALMNAEKLIDQKGMALDDAVKLLQRYPLHDKEAVMPVYRRLVKCLMMRSQESEYMEGVDHRDAIASLRDVLYKQAREIKTKEMNELLLATHYQHIFYLAESLGCKDIAAKCAVTLLKYPSVVPQDRAFYQAGMIAKELELTNVAFVLLNRYIDIVEAIDSGDASRVDNQDFYETDAIPLNDAPIPTTHYVTDKNERDACRLWVLSAITDSSIDQSIPPRDRCRKTLFEGFYQVNKPSCIVTGFPVHPADKLEVNNVVANRADWNSIVSKTSTCPWSGFRNQRPLY